MFYFGLELVPILIEVVPILVKQQFTLIITSTDLMIADSASKMLTQESSVPAVA
jgi:hypothetical protein